jgi:sugar (pentulose or hexulose) kinase
MPEGALLVGLDVGTGGCRALVFDSCGRTLGFGHREYGIDSSEPAMAEQDAEQVWKLACESLHEAVAAAESAGEAAGAAGGGLGKIAALSVSVQGDAVIPVDGGLHAIGPAILGMDYRSQPQAARVGEMFGERELFQRTGMRPHPINSVLKTLWLKEARPDVYHRAARIVTYEDFILGRLGAEPSIDQTMASRTMAFDLRTKEWATDILEQLDISPGLFSRVVPSGTAIGRVSRPAAVETGLAQGIVLASGGHDQACSAIGAGLIDEGIALVSTGSAEVTSNAFRAPALGEAMFAGFYPCNLYVLPEMYYTFALNHVGGLLLKWYRDQFAFPEVQEARALGCDPYDLILQRVPKEPSRLIVLPHFNGSGTPWCDMDSKGAIVGLSLMSDRHELARSILESLACEVRANLEALEHAGIRVHEIRATGGGARSPLWLQIKADVLGRPIRTLCVRETASLGAAILAGAAVGLYPSIEAGVRRTVHVAEEYQPREEVQSVYTEKFRVHKKLYLALKEVFQHIR